MAFITDAELKQAVADMLKEDVDNLDALWGRITTQANTSAYGDICSRLLGRGYTQDQVDSWDRGAEFNRDIGLFWSFVKGAGLHSYDDRFIKLLDRREELEKVILVDGDTELEVDEDLSAVKGGTQSFEDEITSW